MRTNSCHLSLGLHQGLSIFMACNHASKLPTANRPPCAAAFISRRTPLHFRLHVLRMLRGLPVMRSASSKLLSKFAKTALAHEAIARPKFGAWSVTNTSSQETLSCVQTLSGRLGAEKTAQADRHRAAPWNTGLQSCTPCACWRHIQMDMGTSLTVKHRILSDLATTGISDGHP